MERERRRRERERKSKGGEERRERKGGVGVEEEEREEKRRQNQGRVSCESDEHAFAPAQLRNFVRERERVSIAALTLRAGPKVEQKLF